nr:unnamed protein product [Spirometra erinaceieuropaei]
MVPPPASSSSSPPPTNPDDSSDPALPSSSSSSSSPTAPTAAAQATVPRTATDTTTTSPDSRDEDQDYTCPHCDRTFTSHIGLETTDVGQKNVFLANLQEIMSVAVANADPAATRHALAYNMFCAVAGTGNN